MLGIKQMSSEIYNFIMLAIAAYYISNYGCVLSLYISCLPFFELFEAPPLTKTSWRVENSLRLSVTYLFLHNYSLKQNLKRS